MVSYSVLTLRCVPMATPAPQRYRSGALEEYFHVQGREWERFAWLKSRVVAPAAAVGSATALQLRGVVVPFVFRRYLDYNVFDSLRILHRQIREHAAKRSAGRPERSNDVKLSRGASGKSNLPSSCFKWYAAVSIRTCVPGPLSALCSAWCKPA